MGKSRCAHMLLVLLLHAAQGQTCGPGHLELDFVNALLINNNLGNGGKSVNNRRWKGKGYIRYGNVRYLGERMVDLIIVSRESDSAMTSKCDGALPSPTPLPKPRPSRGTAQLTAALV